MAVVQELRGKEEIRRGQSEEEEEEDTTPSYLTKVFQVRSRCVSRPRKGRWVENQLLGFSFREIHRCPSSTSLPRPAPVPPSARPAHHLQFEQHGERSR